MLYIGSHVGFNKNTQLLGSAKEALKYKANTFMFYTGAPQNTARSPIVDELTLEALQLLKEKRQEEINDTSNYINLLKKEIENYEDIQSEITDIFGILLKTHKNKSNYIILIIFTCKNLSNYI